MAKYFKFLFQGKISITFFDFFLRCIFRKIPSPISPSSSSSSPLLPSTVQCSRASRCSSHSTAHQTVGSAGMRSSPGKLKKIINLKILPSFTSRGYMFVAHPLLNPKKKNKSKNNRAFNKFVKKSLISA